MKNNFNLTDRLDTTLDLRAPDFAYLQLDGINDELKQLRKKAKKAKEKKAKRGKKGKKAKRALKKLKREIREREQERDMLKEQLRACKCQLQLAMLNPPRKWWQDALVQSSPEAIRLLKAYIERPTQRNIKMIDTTARDIDPDQEKH